ncbi:MAG: hypothetical protein CM15mP83_7480 [Flavobacteriaceae bacterium]|nr:MAG: hypothetical protein CM15mP83_7480 [Flavobacteriaceae bacterium]
MKKTYETIKSSEQLVDVTEGPLANRAVNPTTHQGAVSIDSPFKFIALDTSFVPINTPTFLIDLFYLLWGSPLGLVLLYVVYARRKQNNG